MNTISSTITALRAVGVTVSDPAPAAPFTAPQVTIEQVTAAIDASTAPNPYQDPAVVPVLTEYQARQHTTALAQAHAEQQAASTKAAFLTNLTTLDQQVRDKFTAQATILTSAAQTLPTVDDLDTFDYTTATPAQASAALEAKQAIHEIEKILNAWEQLHNLDSAHIANTNARKFFALNYTPTQWKAAQHAGKTTIWNGATSGVQLSLATSPAAATARYTAALNS